ncbi:MAG: bifunctional DNA-formamidopyrimidine glycosylase/DNA-(apurinic or apyrimidinic site) lyase [Bryobacteraceae bacterium]
MPELPEVETVVRGLVRSIAGRTISAVRIGKSDFIDDPAELERQLPGRRIARVERFGKFISLAVAQAHDGAVSGRLFVHLGMTGRLIPRRPEDPVAPHTHVYFAFEDGGELRYTDARRFGRMVFLQEPQAAAFIAKLGIEPLEISESDFVVRLGSRSARIKALLLDQGVLRGMGNIYADESLWRSRIHPARLGANLSSKQLRTLYATVRKVLQAAIQLRGSSISDFLDSEGNPGEYQTRHRVYGRAGKPCPRCRTLIRRSVVAGRGSYFCPRCQPPPREGKKRPAIRRPGKKSKARPRRA